jgi:hypothetical protein
MRTWTKTAAATAAAAALVTGGVVVTSASAISSPASTYTIHLTAVQTNERNFFTGPHGSPQPGDHIAFQQRLFYDAQRKDLAGFAFITCTFDFGNQSACTADATLYHRGGIVVEGISPNSNSFSLAIVGGTEEFADAGGSADVSGGGGHVQTIVLHIEN